MPRITFTLSSGEQRLFDFDADRATIGRSSHNDLVLPDSTVSYQHGEFTRHLEGYIYRDNASTNGSTVNGAEPDGGVLKPGDRLVLGTCPGIYTAGPERQPATAELQPPQRPPCPDPEPVPDPPRPVSERIHYTQCEFPVPPDPLDFAAIPAGDFTMGDTLDGTAATPRHVHISAFSMQTKQVSMAQWDEVRSWGLLHGYPDLALGEGKAASHPIQTVTWHDVLKWCNAKSEMDGLTPCYYTDAAQTTVYRTGTSNPDNSMVKWSARGYRLPTEAEWEKAARGGLPDKRFPRGDKISHKLANFNNTRREFYQTGTTGYHPAFATGPKPYTSPVGSFPPNGFGLYDMAGNVWDWCWDSWCGSAYYASAPTHDPRGPDAGPCRVVRGGSWLYEAMFARCDCGDFIWPDSARDFIGFRLAQGPR